MKSPRALRVYRTQNRPSPLAMGAINELSFQCWNMADNGPPGAIQKLAKDLPDGTRVTVMRVGGLSGELHAMEFVTVEGGELLAIILSSAANESYIIPFTLPSCKIGTGVQKMGIPATFFKDTYVDPWYDLYAETCPFLFTLDHKSFIAVVHNGPVYQSVTKNRDDWHNNQYQNNADLSVGQRYLTYYDSLTRRYVNEVRVSFSFSPYTRNLGLSHIGRYIDHSRRLYIPILGRGTAFEAASPKLAGCVDFPFGKKPFTRTAGGFSSYREVVRASGGLPSPDVVNFNMRLLWPFIPYVHEIPYLAVQYQNLGSLSSPVPRLSLQDIGPLASYELRYNTDESTLVTEPIRTDAAAGSFPAVATSESETTNISPVNNVVSGESSSLSSQGNTQTYSVNKSATIGTVGAKLDLHVVTALTGTVVYDYSVSGYLTRESNFPGQYYMPEFVDDLFWPCGLMEDATNAGQDTNIQSTNTITGSQALKIGDLVLDSGDISMVYTGSETGTITHNGTATRTAACACPTISFTSQQMSVSTSQTLAVSAAENGAVYTWAVSGGGSLNTTSGGTVIYTAPATNANCADNPTISLYEAGRLCDTLKLAINATTPDADAYEYWNTPVDEICYQFSPSICIASCAQVTISGYKCNGTFRRDIHTCNCGGGSLFGGACSPAFCVPALANCSCHTPEAAVAACGHASPVDVRTGAMILAGCCPAQVL